MDTRVSTTATLQRIYSFGNFTLDLERGALQKCGADVRLRPKSFEMLCYLVENHGRLVSKEELLNAVWGRTVVTEGSIAQCLIDIRRALGGKSDFNALHSLHGDNGLRQAAVQACVPGDV